MNPLKMLRNSPDLSLPPRPSFGMPKSRELSLEVEMEAPEGEEGAEGEEESDEDSAKDAAGYVKADQRCSTCAHCEADRCQLFDFTCEPDGGCPEHEAGGGAAGMPPPTDDMPAEE
jgi:hypothetical protein